MSRIRPDPAGSVINWPPRSGSQHWLKIINAQVKTERAQPSQPKHDILICPPNRLVYMINHEPPLVNLARVEWLIVDEADKLFEVGWSTKLRVI
jgi:superfamily II DNA/RNA helicase